VRIPIAQGLDDLMHEAVVIAENEAEATRELNQIQFLACLA
jgi:hypothetical protein